MNALEKQLRSWAPRRVSAALERRIFGAQAALAANAPSAGGDYPLPTFRLSWLAPAAAAAMLVCAMLHQRNGLLAYNATGAGPMVAAALSNQSVAPYLPGSFAREQNGVEETLAWTKGGYLTSSTGSVSAARGTN